jgi:hypothetical protein
MVVKQRLAALVKLVPLVDQINAPAAFSRCATRGGPMV